MKDLNSLFRPKKWKDVKGQNRAVEMLKKQVLLKSGLANSYIFAGRSGIGKTTLVRLFFMAINCNELDKEGNPCLKCFPCSNIGFELLEINASNMRGIDDMRNLSENMKLMPIGNYKGVLLDEVHMLTKPAWNCLLKPIEESGEKGIWFFCTTELHKIPKTIQTRCQIYKLNQFRWTDIFNRIKDIAKISKIKIEEEHLWIIARNSDNNLRQAIHLLEQFSVIGDMKKIISEEINMDFIKAVADKDIKIIWKIMNNWDKKYDNIDTFFSNLKFDLNTCLKLKMGLPVTNLSPYRLKVYEKILPKLTEDRLMGFLEILLKTQEKISGVWDYNSLFLNALCNFKNI